MNLLINDEELLKKYKEIWNKVKHLFKRKFNSELMHNDKYIKIKIKICNNKVYTDFQYNKIPKDNILHVYL